MRRWRERDTHCSKEVMGGEERSAPPGSVREIGTYTAYSGKKTLAGVNGVQMDASAPTVHTYTEARNTCTLPPPPPPPPPPPLTQRDALHLQQGFPPGYTPLRTVFLTLLSHILYPVFLRWHFFLFHRPPELNSEPSRNNKY